MSKAVCELGESAAPENRPQLFPDGQRLDRTITVWAGPATPVAEPMLNQPESCGRAALKFDLVEQARTAAVYPTIREFGARDFPGR